MQRNTSSPNHATHASPCFHLSVGVFWCCMLSLSMHCPACTVPCCWPPPLHRFPFCKPRRLQLKGSHVSHSPALSCTALHCMFCFVLYCSHLPSHSHTTLSVSTYVYIHRGCFIPVFPSLRRRRRKTRPAGHGEERRRDRSTPLVRFLPALLRRQRQRHLPLICPSVRPRSPAAGHGRKATRMAVALLACRRPACSAGAACQRACVLLLARLVENLMVTRASSARACRPDPDVRRPVRPVVLSSAPIPSHPLPAASLARAGRALCHARFRHLCRSRSGCFLAWLLSIGDGICPTAACLATPHGWLELQLEMES